MYLLSSRLPDALINSLQANGRDSPRFGDAGGLRHPLRNLRRNRLRARQIDRRSQLPPHHRGCYPAEPFISQVTTEVGIPRNWLSPGVAQQTAYGQRPPQCPGRRPDGSSD